MLELILQWWNLLLGASPEIAVKAFIVLVSVFLLRLISVVPTSNWARAANVVLSVLLSGVTSGAATEEEVLILTLTSVVSGMAWEAVKWLYGKVNRGKAIFLPNRSQ